MIGYNALTLGQRVIKQLFRDHRTIAMILVIPVLITLIFGYALGGTVENVPVVIINLDTGKSLSVGPVSVNISLGQDILDQMKSDSRISLQTSNSFQSAKTDVDKSALYGAILIPVNFTQDFVTSFINGTSTEQAAITVYLDGTQPAIATGIMASLQDAINASTSELASKAGKSLSLKVNQEFANGISNLNQLDVSIPAVMALILNFLVLLFSTLFLVRENTYKTKGRLLATPIHPREIIIGYTIALMIIAVCMSLSVLIISIFLFNAHMAGDIWQLLLCITIFGSIFVFMGVFLSNFAKNELQAVQMGPLIAFPSMALSGFLVPVSTLPAYLQPIASIVPMTYGINLFRGIMLRGYDITEMLPDFVIVVGFAVLFLVLAIITIKGTTD